MTFLYKYTFSGATVGIYVGEYGLYQKGVIPSNTAVNLTLNVKNKLCKNDLFLNATPYGNTSKFFNSPKEDHEANISLFMVRI